MSKHPTKQAWQEKNKADALKMMKEVQKRIQNDSLIVTTCGFWPSGSGGTCILRVDVIDSDSVKLSDQS